MISDIDPLFQGCILEDENELSLGDLCRACEVHAEYIIALVDEGILEPVGRRQGDWRFGGIGLQRARITLRLQRDLGVNLAGAALVLDLMDEVQRLRARVDRLG